MKIADVEGFLLRIELNKNSDPETAHAERDQLYLAVISAIAQGNEQGRGPYPGKTYDDDVDLAREALKAQDIKLRWEACA